MCQNQAHPKSGTENVSLRWFQIFSPKAHRGLGLVLLLSGMMGFFLGCWALPDWQVAVETAQVVAGLVDYPKDNVFYLYHVKLWTLLHQILAVLLQMGVSEKGASLLVSGLLGLVTLQAFATIILALSGDWLLALGGTLAVFFCRPNEVGVVYPVWFMGTEHTYGVLGLSYMLLVIGLLGGGWRKMGALLLGLAPAVHPSLGFWLGVMVGGCCLLDLRRFRENWLPWLKFFFLGGAMTTVSLIWQMTVIYDGPKSPPVDASRYFHAFVSFWDMHRAPVNAAHPGVAFNGWVLFLSLLGLIFLRKDWPANSALIIRAMLVASALGLGAMGLSWVSPEKLPRTLVMLMPARLLNFPIFASLPVLIGVIGIYRHKVWGQMLGLTLLVVGLCGGAVVDGGLMFYSSHLWQLLVAKGANPASLPKFMINPWQGMIVISLATLLMAIFSRWKLSSREKASAKTVAKSSAKKNKPSLAAPSTSPEFSSTVLWLRRVSWILFAGFLVLTLMLSAPAAKYRAGKFQDRTNNLVLAAAAKGRGTLLTGGDLHLVQLRTRRPVLLDGGGLDGIAYILPAAPKMTQILRDVYKIDLFHPPEAARGAGAIPTAVNKSVWERFPLEHWQEIGKKYDVREVLTYGDWQLQLPRVIGDEAHVLYQIPE